MTDQAKRGNESAIKAATEQLLLKSANGKLEINFTTGEFKLKT